ncbi:MAG: nuclear transport factor 2 family protein [Planctomycetaceae bacterium]
MSPLVAAQWFTETPWPPIVVAGLFAAFAFIGWMGTRRGMYLVAVGVIAAACVGIFYVERAIVTEGEVVEQHVRDLADAFRRKDPTATLEHFSAQATRERFLVAWAMAAVTVHDDLTITDMQIELAAQGSRATSHFRANGTIELLGRGILGHRPSRWLLTWQKEGGAWRIIHVEQLDPINGRPIEIPFMGAR